MKCIPNRDYEEEYENIRTSIIEEENFDDDDQDYYEDFINSLADEEFEKRFGFKPDLVL